MKLTIIGNPDEISKLLQLFTEEGDETEEIEETDEIGFLATKKARRQSGKTIVF